MASNTEFNFRGINHLALVSSDMARTVDFYTNVLGMPLITPWWRRLRGLPPTSGAPAKA